MLDNGFSFMDENILSTDRTSFSSILKAQNLQHTTEDVCSSFMNNDNIHIQEKSIHELHKTMMSIKLM